MERKKNQILKTISQNVILNRKKKLFPIIYKEKNLQAAHDKKNKGILYTRHNFNKYLHIGDLNFNIYVHNIKFNKKLHYKYKII